MTPEKWQKINDLFHSALAVDADERVEHVRKGSDGDEEVFAEVSKLLQAHVDSGDFICEPVVRDLTKVISVGNGNSAAPKSETLVSGEALGHYIVRDKLGKGGMGEVYLCRDKSLGRDVAIKVLLPEFTLDSDRIKRFQQEAKAASALNHPNILTIHEIGQTADLRFIATEYVKGRTLTNVLKNERLSLSNVLKIAVQICSALDAAHQANIIHRDIKPDNVMIRDDGIVKVLDFGLAKLSESPSGQTESATLLAPLSIDSGSPRTSPGMIMGTPDYMSPEQARGKEVDGQTDIFSFGVLLYQMLSGMRPFAGETMSDVIAAVLTKEPKPLAEIDPTIPVELGQIVAKTLRKEKDDRYPTAAALLQDLTDLAEELKAQDRLERSVVPNADEAKTVAFRRTTIDDQVKTVAATQNAKKKGPIAIIAAGLLAVVLVVTGFFGYQYLSPSRQIDSIAVMPFVNEGGNPDLEYLSDGMTETLIKSLSGIPDLSVKARSSVFRYKGQQTDIKKIAGDLGVQAVITGKIVQRNEEIILSLDLVEAATEKNLWNERYTRKRSDIVSLQNEIAKDVSNNLKARLTGAEQAKIASSGTVNSEAYQLYLKGRYFMAKGTQEAPEQALKYFQDAVALDPKFALGYAGIADSYSLIGTIMQSQKADETLPPAKIAAEKAIQLDPNLSEAYVSLAWIRFRYDWDWAGSEKDFKKAIELDPNNAQAHQWYGELLSCLRRDDEAIAAFKRARDLEPFNLLMNWNLAKGYHDIDRYDEAIAEARKIYEMDRNFRRTYRILRQSYEVKQMFAEAYEIALQELVLNNATTSQIEAYSKIYERKGYKAANRYRLESELKENKNLSASLKAVYYRSLDDKDNMFYWLEEAYKKRESGLLYLKLPTYYFVKDDPRYNDLLRRMNFPG